MKKWILTLTALILTMTFGFSFAAALEDTVTNGPVTLSFEANATTGFAWTGFILGGDSVELDAPEGTYTMNENPEGMAGVGGVTSFTLTPVKPGKTIIAFTYARPWEADAGDRVIVLAVVGEDLSMYVTDVTEAGVLTGVVTEVNEEDHSVLMTSELVGDVIARFDEDMALPVINENITVYTDGTMTMSLPGIVNVIAWESIPDDLARMDGSK